MSTRNHLPNTVEASLGARLAPFNGIPATPLEDLDAEVQEVTSEGSDAVAVRNRQQGSQPGFPPIPVVLRSVDGVGMAPDGRDGAAPIRPSIAPCHGILRGAVLDREPEAPP